MFLREAHLLCGHLPYASQTLPRNCPFSLCPHHQRMPQGPVCPGHAARVKGKVMVCMIKHPTRPSTDQTLSTVAQPELGLYFLAFRTDSGILNWMRWAGGLFTTWLTDYFGERPKVLLYFVTPGQQECTCRLTVRQCNYLFTWSFSVAATSSSSTAPAKSKGNNMSSPSLSLLL